MRVFASHFTLSVLLFVLFSGQSRQAWAGGNYRLRRSLVIRDAPEPKAQIILRLEEGAEISATVRRAGGRRWKRIDLSYEGTWFSGYVSTRKWKIAARRANFDSEFPEEIEERKGPTRSLRYGVSLVGSLFYQGARTFESENTGSVSIDALTGSSFFSNVFLEMPVMEVWWLQARINLRSTFMTGAARIGSGTVSSTPSQVKLAQQFMGAGLTLKRYASRFFWWSFGGEVDRGTSVDLDYGTEDVEVSSSALPVFAILHGSLGIDYLWRNEWAIVPELRMGMVVNTTPPSLITDFILGFSF